MSKIEKNIDIRLFEKPDASIVKAIDDLLITHNEKTLATPRKAMALAAYDKEKFLGGIYFRWYGTSAIIEYMAVKEKSRRHGIGKRLLNAAEKEMRRQGCRRITVDSVSHQAPEFYRRFGYEIMATIPQFYDGQDRLILRKALAEGPVSDEQD